MRRTSRSPKKNGRIPENLSDHAAWLYTDLLLGLAVAFVGAGTFLVYDKTTKSDKGDTPVILTYQLSCDEVILTVPRTIEPSSLNSEVITAIDEAATAHNWKEPKAGLLYIYGGSGGQDVGVGSTIGHRFNSQVVSSTPKLGNVEKIVGGDKSLSTEDIRLEMYIVYKGDETKNGCK
jgi:hypothetical protein